MYDQTTAKNIYYTKNILKDYYKKTKVSSVIDISKREFGIGTFGKKISNRHLLFNNHNDFNEYLVNQVPFFVSYSAAYYKYPNRRPMENKQIEGADLIYEFDSDDFDLDCHNKHNIWHCKNCDVSGVGNLKTCPDCGEAVNVDEWTCDVCLNKAKQETKRLYEFLENNLKLDSKSFVISFSGSKGYHIRVTDKQIINLSKSARIQITSYISAEDLKLKELGFVYQNKQWYCPSIKESYGWAKDILLYIKNMLENNTIKELQKKYHISLKKAEEIYKNKEVILNNLEHKFLWSQFNGSSNFWKYILNKAIEDLRFEIDLKSSIDIYKIMRVPDTIHGGTGFLSTHIKTIDDLLKYDPFYDPVVLGTKRTIKVKVIKQTPKFRIKDEIYGPYMVDEKVELPEEVVVFLILKGVVI
jgi:DNA primase small subunit